MDIYILVINPGSTSTKFAVFKNEEVLFEEKISHDIEELKVFPNIVSQTSFRKELILNKLKEKKFDLKLLRGVCGRGGMLKPLKSGTYLVNEEMLNDLKETKYGQHASNLGAIIANEIAKPLNIPAYIVDPVCVD